MPRRSKGARLWLESEERDARGKLVRHATWVIRDGARKVRTGCARGDRAGAERALAEASPASTEPRAIGPPSGCILVLDVLNIYLADKAGEDARPEDEAARPDARRLLAAPHACGCKRQALPRYVHGVSASLAIGEARSDGERPRLVTEAAARRELEDLRAAINHHRQEGLCSEIVSVGIPRRDCTRALVDAIRGGTAHLGGMAGAAGHARSAHRASGRPAPWPASSCSGCTPALATRRFAVLR